CTKARFAGWIGIDLNALLARSCCWSSTLFSHEAKLTLTETIAARTVRVMVAMSCTRAIAPIPPKPDIAISALALAVLYPIMNFPPLMRLQRGEGLVPQTIARCLRRF